MFLLLEYINVIIFTKCLWNYFYMFVVTFLQTQFCFHNLTEPSDENENYVHLNSSPDPVGHVSYCHHQASTLDPLSPFVNYHIFDISITTGPMLSKLPKVSQVGTHFQHFLRNHMTNLDQAWLEGALIIVSNGNRSAHPQLWHCY